MTWVTPDPNWWPLVLILAGAGVIALVVEHLDRRDAMTRYLDRRARAARLLDRDLRRQR